jgi:hypothetical protein
MKKIKSGQLAFDHIIWVIIAIILGIGLFLIVKAVIKLAG